MHQGGVRMRWFGVIMEGEIWAEEEGALGTSIKKELALWTGKKEIPVERTWGGRWYKVSTHSMPGAKLGIWHSRSP